MNGDESSLITLRRDVNATFDRKEAAFTAALHKRDKEWREDQNCLRRAISGLQNRVTVIETERIKSPEGNRKFIYLSLGGGIGGSGTFFIAAKLVERFLT